MTQLIKDSFKLKFHKKLFKCIIPKTLQFKHIQNLKALNSTNVTSN